MNQEFENIETVEWAVDASGTHRPMRMRMKLLQMYEKIKEIT